MRLSIVIPVVVVLSACSFLVEPDPPSTPVSNFDQLWNEFDQMYALFDVKGIDWAEQYSTFKPLLNARTSDSELFRIMSDLLTVLDDKHVFLSSSVDYFNSGGYPLQVSNFSLTVAEQYLENSKIAGDDVFTYGSINDSIGYIHIAAFTSGHSGVKTRQDWASDIDLILHELQDASGMIIDVRDNTGGLPQNVMYIANRFADEERHFMTLQTKNGPRHQDLKEPTDYYISPAGPIQFTGPIILLTNTLTISGGEWFTLALKTLPYVTHMGGTTAGAQSLAISRDLMNGWTYSISVQLIESTYGICHEGIGISPEEEFVVLNTEEELQNNIDRELETAISSLRTILDSTN